MPVVFAPNAVKVLMDIIFMVLFDKILVDNFSAIAENQRIPAVNRYMVN